MNGVHEFFLQVYAKVLGAMSVQLLEVYSFSFKSVLYFKNRTQCYVYAIYRGYNRVAQNLSNAYFYTFFYSLTLMIDGFFFHFNIIITSFKCGKV